MKIRFALLLAPTAGVLLLAGCLSPRIPSPTPDEQGHLDAAELVLAKFEYAVNQKNFPAAVSLFAPNGKATDDQLWHAQGAAELLQMYRQIGPKLIFGYGRRQLVGHMEGDRAVFDGHYSQILRIEPDLSTSYPQSPHPPRAMIRPAAFRCVLSPGPTGNWQIVFFETFTPASSPSQYPTNSYVPSGTFDRH